MEKLELEGRQKIANSISEKESKETNSQAIKEKIQSKIGELNEKKVSFKEIATRKTLEIKRTIDETNKEKLKIIEKLNNIEKNENEKENSEINNEKKEKKNGLKKSFLDKFRSKRKGKTIVILPCEEDMDNSGCSCSCNIL